MRISSLTRISRQPPLTEQGVLQQQPALRRSYCITLSLSACLLVTFTACGKRRPPLPPFERIPQRTESLIGFQRGNQVNLSWPAPSRNAPNASVQSIRRIDIYRLAESSSAPLPLTEEEFAARSTLIGSLTLDVLENTPTTLTYQDTLELAGEPTRLRYALRYVNAEGQRAAFSNFLLIEPAATIAQPPTIIDLTEKENSITIQWQPPQSNIDLSTPVNLLGYNIYRLSEPEKESPSSPLNSTLVQGAQYVDKNFRFETKYQYFMRAVSLGTGGMQVESLNSNAVQVTPHDKYPPTAPAQITIAAAPGKLSLFFPANPEPDVIGYKVFRSTDPSLPLDQWVLLTQPPVTTTTFQDTNVESGRRYYYYLVAIDAAENVSPSSETTSEIAP